MQHGALAGVRARAASGAALRPRGPLGNLPEHGELVYDHKLAGVYVLEIGGLRDHHDLPNRQVKSRNDFSKNIFTERAHEFEINIS